MFRHRLPHQISFAFCILALCIAHSSALGSSIQRTPGALNMLAKNLYAAMEARPR